MSLRLSVISEQLGVRLLGRLSDLSLLALDPPALDSLLALDGAECRLPALAAALPSKFRLLLDRGLAGEARARLLLDRGLMPLLKSTLLSSWRILGGFFKNFIPASKHSDLKSSDSFLLLRSSFTRLDDSSCLLLLGFFIALPSSFTRLDDSSCLLEFFIPLPFLGRWYIRPYFNPLSSGKSKQEFPELLSLPEGGKGGFSSVSPVGISLS